MLMSKGQTHYILETNIFPSIYLLDSRKNWLVSDKLEAITRRNEKLGDKEVETRSVTKFDANSVGLVSALSRHYGWQSVTPG